MSSLYNPPLHPYGTSTMAGLTGNAYAPTKNPFYSIGNQFLPRNLHDVIKWARYITVQSPVTTEVVRKLATFPITSFLVDSDKKVTQEKYKQIFKSFKLKSALHDIGFEYYTVGNVFISIYFPIHRTLQCPHCASEFNAKHAEFTKFVNFKFEGDCPKCLTKGEFIVKDTKSFNIDDMNLIKWDPLNIAINHNPITNEYEYFYKIPNEIRRRVKQGDKLFVNSVPWAFIEAIKNNQDFKFDNNNIFHLKNVSAGHLVEGAAIPPLVSQFNLVFYQATLRKANEAVANDYMAPMRVIFPQAQSANSDPIISMSMKNFVSNMQQAIVRHKADNSHVLIAPTPVGYQAISGEGKALLVSQEIMQAEESLLLSLGVSRELLSGTTNWTSSTVGLRMLENTMFTYVDQIESLVDWVMNRVSKYLNIETAKVTLAPFRLTDDENLRQVLLQLNQTGNASLTTLYESYGLDYKEEMERVKQDAIDQAINKAKQEIEVNRGVFLASREIADKLDHDDEYKGMLSKAQAVAEQLMQMDDNGRRQVLNQLKLEDYSLYLMSSQLLEEYNKVQKAQENLAAMEQGAAQEAAPAEGGEAAAPEAEGTAASNTAGTGSL